jgi:DNA polymerase-3 subunit epsilon
MLTFDVESSGVNVETDRIVTATTAWVSRSGAEPTTWLINPGIDIPAEATRIHGVTTEQAREFGRPPALALEEIATSLQLAWADGVPVVGFNIAYDLTILDRELRRNGLAALDPEKCQPVIDPLVIDRAAFPRRRGSRKLVDLCKLYGVALDEAHNATQDALAAGRLVWVMVRDLADMDGCHIRDMPRMRLSTLHASQVGWHAYWAQDFRAWLVSKGRTDDLPDGAWPLRRYVEEGAA